MRLSCGFLFYLLIVTLSFGEDQNSGSVDSSSESSEISVASEASYPPYGFSGLEIYKTDFGIFNISFADFNKNGVKDIAFINNVRSRVELFIRLDDDQADNMDPLDPENINQITFDGRYRKEFITVEQTIVGIAPGLFNDDDTMDIALVTDTKDLIVELRGRQRIRKRLEGIEVQWYGVVAGDIDNNGRTDLALMGKDKTLVWFANDEKWLDASPVIVTHLKSQPDYLKLVDMNEDGHLDLVYVYFKDQYPLHIRYLEAPGRFGPVTTQRMEGIRAFCFHELFKKDGADKSPAHAMENSADLLVVHKNSGRLTLFRPGEHDEPFMAFYPLSEDKKNPAFSFCTANIQRGEQTGQGATQVIMADKNSAKVGVLDGFAASSPVETRYYPSLRSVSNPRVADLQNDKTPELVVISETEQVIGICPAVEPLAFPTLYPLEGKPAAMDAGDINSDGSDEVVTLCTRGVGSKMEYILNILQADETGALKNEFQVLQKSKPKKKIIKKAPDDLLLIDLNRDGLKDLVLFESDNVPVIFFNKGKNEFEFAMGEDTPGLGILDEARAWTVCPADADNDGRIELAACSGNLVRFLFIPENAEIPQAVRQYNSPQSSDRFAGCAFGDVAGDEAPELILYETTGSRLHVVDAQGKPVMKIDMDPFSFTGLEAIDLNGDNKKDILIKGPDRVGVHLSGQTGLSFKEKGAFESPDKDCWFMDLAFGDLNHDGASDAAVIDSEKNAIYVLSLKNEKIAKELVFKVFDKKLFQSKKSGAQPHTIYALDLTGDNKEDLVILVHDKIIIYPQG